MHSDQSHCTISPGLVSYRISRENRDRRADLAEVVTEDRGFTAIAQTLDLFEEANTT